MDALRAQPGGRAGVYFIYDGDDLLYIGKAANVTARLAAHLSSDKTGIGKFIAGDISVAERLLVAVQETNAAEIYEAFWITELKPRLNSTIHKLEYGPQEPPDLHFAQEIKRYLDLHLLRERAQLFGSRMIDVYAQSAAPKKSAADFSQWTEDHFDQEFGQGFSLIGISQLVMAFKMQL